MNVTFWMDRLLIVDRLVLKQILQLEAPAHLVEDHVRICGKFSERIFFSL